MASSFKAQQEDKPKEKQPYVVLPSAENNAKNKNFLQLPHDVSNYFNIWLPRRGGEAAHCIKEHPPPVLAATMAGVRLQPVPRGVSRSPGASPGWTSGPGSLRKCTHS